MNTSQYMDKQIMDLQTNNSNDFIDLNSNNSTAPHHHDDVTDGGDEILPNYDFQPIRSSHLSSFDTGNIGGPRVWSSAESKPNFTTRNYGSLDSVEPSKAVAEKDRTVLDAALISEIDRTMKKHADNLMHALEGVSARLSQLESRSRNLENSVDDLRTSVGNNHGSTDGKLRQIENIIREVQASVQTVKDKQEILEAQLQLSQVKISKPEQQPQPQPQMATHLDSFLQQVAASAPLQSHHQLPPAAHGQPLPPALPNAPPPPGHHSTQFPQNMQMPPVSHHDPYYSSPGQTAEMPPQQQQQFQLPPPQQQLQPPKASPPSPQPQYPPQATHMQYSQPPPMSLQQPNPSQIQPPMSHHSEEPAYLSSQNYPPSIRQPGGGGPPPQQYNMNQSQMYEPPLARTGLGFPNQYGPSSGFNEPYGYGGSGSQYGSGSPRKSQQHSPPNIGPGGGSGYPQLPTARILPQSLPTAAPVGSSSGSGNSGNRVPVDDVVDKVTHMGFPRDQVRATVKKLTDNGQAVDLNVVLDKLMTDGVESQNPRAWFGR